MRKLLTAFTIASLCSLGLLAISATAQSDMERAGIYNNAASIPRYEAPSQAEINFSVHHIPLDGFVLRTVSNTVYNVSQDKRWSMCEGEVYAKSGDYIIISYSKRNAWLEAVKNYPGDATDGMHVRCIALRSGTVDYSGAPLAVWDCGLPYHPPPPTQEQIKAGEEAEKIRKTAAEKAKKESTAKALQWNQDQADSGDAYGQLRMGERYRDGDGVETNLSKAKAYFMQSSARGNKAAKQELNDLEHRQ